MKLNKFFIAAIAGFAITTASAQVDKVEPRQEEIDDKIQQEQVPPQQRAVENAARQANANTKSNANLRKQEDILKDEKERSIGKEAKNPAESNPTTVKPVRMSDPVSAPPNSGIR